MIRYKKAYDADSFADVKKDPVYIAQNDPTTTYKASPSFSLESKKDVSSGLGIISKTIGATPYYGKRIRLNAYLKAKNVQSRAGMWLKVEDQKGQTINSDTMDNRFISGTQGWYKYECVLDVD